MKDINMIKENYNNYIEQQKRGYEITAGIIGFAIEKLRENFLLNKYSKEEIYDLLSCLNFFNQEFFSLDPRTLNILKSEITRITNCFISDYSIQNTFCCEEKELNFLRI